MGDLARNRAISLTSNYPEIPDGSPFFELAGVVDVAEMLVDRPHVHAEQRRHLALRQPERVALPVHLDVHRPVGRRVEEQLIESCVVAHRGLGFHGTCRRW